METDWKNWKYHKFLILLLITGAVYFFLKYVSPLVTPLLLAMLFVAIFGPALKRIQQTLHIHRQIGAVILLTGFCLLFFSLSWIFVSWLIGSMPAVLEGTENLGRTLTAAVSELSIWIAKRLGVDSVFLEENLLDMLYKSYAQIQDKLFGEVLSRSVQSAGTLAKTGAFGAAFLIGAVLLAKDYDDMMNWMLEREECYLLLEVFCGVIRYFATYVRAQGIIMSAIALLAGFCLQIGGIRHGVLWGVLAGVLDALPFIGTGIVLMPLALYQMLFGSLGRAVLCICLYVACIFCRQILEPRLIGKRIGVPPIAVLISLYAGVRLFGAGGIIKGPMGFVLIYETYRSLSRRMETQAKASGCQKASGGV